jgi:hypothetical protein
MGIKDKISKLTEEELDLTKFPIEVLNKVNKRFEKDEDVERVLRLWREPTSNGIGGFYCNCKTSEFITSDPYTGSDCWLCGGYTY